MQKHDLHRATSACSPGCFVLLLHCRYGAHISETAATVIEEKNVRNSSANVMCVIMCLLLLFLEGKVRGMSFPWLAPNNTVSHTFASHEFRWVCVSG